MLTNAVTDPHELVNLAGKPEFADDEAALRQLVQDYRAKFGPGQDIQPAN